MVLFHADDYGININQSKRIMACTSKGGGVLNSVSIMPNSMHLDETIRMIPEGIKKGIHINLAEGYTCSDYRQVSLLNRNGVMYHSFISLFFLSLIKSREIEEQTSIEILAQIRRVTENLEGEYKIRIDSHVHYHMIPAVFRGMCSALKKSGYEVEYIRYPKEMLSIYLRMPRVWKHLTVINIVKMILLNAFSIINRRTLKEYGYSSCTGLFFGVAFTGEMYGKHVQNVLNKYSSYAFLEKKNLEVLFHPGGIKGNEEFLMGCNEDFRDFYNSENRKKEAKMLCRFKRI